MTTVHLLGYGYTDAALRALVDYGVSEVQEGRATELRFGVFETQEGTLREYIGRVAPDVKYTIGPKGLIPLTSGVKSQTCPCCGHWLP